MSIKINSSIINKLEHEIPEIRIRALKHIEGKLLRGLLQDQEIIFNPGSLIKQLIRWFGQKPLSEEEIVLNLMLMVLRSKYVDETVRYISIPRLKCEVEKIYKILNSNTNCKNILSEIKEILENYEVKESENYDQIQKITSRTPSVESEVIEISSDSIEIVNDEFSSDYEKPWSSISMSDYNSLKLLFESLTSSVGEIDLKHAFKYLQIGIYDYPAEYFLQPPYIFKALLKIYTSDQRLLIENLIQNFIHLTKSLLGRVKMRKLSKIYCETVEEESSKPKVQITVTRYCKELFNLCIYHIRQLAENYDQNQVVLTFRLLFQIISLIEEDPKCYISCESLLIDLGYITKYYRQFLQTENKKIQLERQYYIIFLNLTSKILKYKKRCKRFENDAQKNFVTNPNYHQETTSNRKFIKALNDDDDDTEIWRKELQFAVFDYSLKELYPAVYDSIIDVLSINTNTYIQTILNCDKLLLPAIKLLRQLDQFDNENFIYQGYEAMETLSIHKSLDFVKKIFEIIISCLPLFEGNLHLKEISESIILRLFAHENLSIRRFIYNESANIVKQLFAELMNGTQNFGKICGSTMCNAKIFGIPLTVDILSEIICFGYTHTDPTITKNSEVILCLIIKAKNVLDDKYWKNMLDILLPNVPLLQSIATKDSALGSLVLEFLSPNSDIPHIELIQANIRYLFSSDSSIRSEAISRLIHLLSHDSDSHMYIPKLLEISDTIPNDICILNIPRDPEKIFCRGFYEKSTVFSLLELLKSSDIDPSIRKTTLMQLNVMCQDPELNELIHDENGWYSSIEAMENALKKDPILDYPDTVIPSIGIISKIALANPQFRREISQEKNIYNLLIRSLFIFHHDIVLQQDCVLVIFLLVFSSFIVGSKYISMPVQLSRMTKLPIKVNFHWHTTPFNSKSALETIFLELSEEFENDDNLLNTETLSSSPTISSKSSLKLDLKLLTTTRTVNILQKPALQYIRLNFASLWFDGFDCILKLMKKIRKARDVNSDSNLNYYLLPGYIRKIKNANNMEIKDSIKLNQYLQLTDLDVKIIKSTLQSENVEYFLKKILNAVTHNDVLINLHRIELALFLNATCCSYKIKNNNKKEELKTTNIIDCFRKFIMQAPNLNSETDLILYENVINFFIYLLEENIDDNNRTILKWISNELKEKNPVQLMMLKNFYYPRSLYQSICNFLEIFIKQTIKINLIDKTFIQKYIVFTETVTATPFKIEKSSKLGKNNVQEKIKIHQNLYNKIFEYLMSITEECFHKRLLSRFRSLINLIEILSSTYNLCLDSGYISSIVKKLLHFIMTLKSFTQAGSNYVENCLLIIGNLIFDLDKFILDDQHIRFLSGLCGHLDFEIRGLSWCIIGKVTKCLKGAQAVVKELSFLPGGFHACCLSTFLDKNEIPLVRIAAGNCFSNLLMYKEKSNESGFDLIVVPLCTEYDPNGNVNGLELIEKIFERHKFFMAINKSLEYFYIADIIIETQLNEITTCDIVITYCSILTNYIDLKPKVVDKVVEENFLMKIINLIKRVPSWLTKSSLEMTGAICELLLRILILNSTFLQRHIIHDREFIATLMQLLNLKHFENFNDLKVLIPVIEILRLLNNDTISFKIICDIFSCDEYFNAILSMLNYAVLLEDNQGFQNASLKFLIALLIKSQTDKYKFITFSQILDSNVIQNFTNTSKNSTEITNESSCDQKFEGIGKNFIYGSEILFFNVKSIFENNFINKSGQKIQGNIKVLTQRMAGVLLKTTQKSRDVAKTTNFLRLIVQNLDNIFDGLGMQCTDFIRKYGDNKKIPIIQEIIILFEIILNWYSCDCLEDEIKIIELCKIIIKTWPWISHSDELKILIFKCLAFLSEDSIPVCKKFSTTISTYSHSILQLVVNIVLIETKKVKHPSIDFTVLKIGLRILANCCSCIEGRVQIVKINLLDIFSLFHPSITKLQKSWNLITLYWLKFWNIFSRYPEGSTVRHLILISNLIVKANESIRFECIIILRNMSFFNSNRAALLSSDDFLYIIKYILSNCTVEEKFLITTALWKLIADNFKAKHTIKNTSIPYQLKMISEKVSSLSSSVTSCKIIKASYDKENDDIQQDNVENDLLNVIEIVLKILN